MKLYWCKQTRSTRAIWMLEETGLPYDLVEVDIRDPKAPRESDFLRASPLGKVPALVDGKDVAIWDSAAICLYLADKAAGEKLCPPVGDPKRAAYYYWMMFTPGIIEPAMAEKASGRTPNKMQSGWGSFDDMIRLLSDGVAKSDWLLGDAFSAADVMVGSSANFMKLFGMLPDNKPIEAYIARCLERPAYAKAMAMSF